MSTTPASRTSPHGNRVKGMAHTTTGCTLELDRQTKDATRPCVLGKTFGCHAVQSGGGGPSPAARVTWVRNGCRGMFRCGPAEKLFKCGMRSLGDRAECTCPPHESSTLCPAGTGSPHAEQVLLRQRGATAGVWEDRVWAESRAGCNESEIGSHLQRQTPYECIVVPSRQLIISLVWKTGTKSLAAFAKCAFGAARANGTTGARVYIGGSAAGFCAKTPLHYKHVAVVRDPLERFLSGYDEFLNRVAWKILPRDLNRWSWGGWASHGSDKNWLSGGKDSASRLARFLRFVNASRCHSEGSYGHVATQSWFLRERRVDVLLRKESLDADLVAHFGAPHCVRDKALNSRHNTEYTLSEERYWSTLRQNTQVRRALCKMYLQDLVCLHPGHVEAEGGAAAAASQQRGLCDEFTEGVV